MKKQKKIQVVREINQKDKAVIKALELAKRFEVLTYPETSAILEPKLSSLLAPK